MNVNVDELTDFELVKLRYEKEELSDVFSIAVDYYPSILQPDIERRVNLYELLQSIRTNHKVLLDPELMFNPKFVDGRRNHAYDSRKRKLPAVCFNAWFNGSKKLGNLISPTNLMYLDLDGFQYRQEADEYRNEIVSKYDWIVSCSLSLSKLGLHILIWVDQIGDNKDFNLKYDFVNNQFFDGRLDPMAKSLTRYTIIPADYSIYINENPSPLNIDEMISDMKGKVVGNGIERKEIMYTACTFLPVKGKSGSKQSKQYDIPIRLSEELDDSEFDDPNIPVYFPKGIDMVEIDLSSFRRKKVYEGRRTSIIGAIGSKLIYLNGNLVKQYQKKLVENSLMNYLLKINQTICKPPLSDTEVKNSFHANWKRFIDGELDVTNLKKKKRAFWSSKSTLTGNEKRKVTCMLREQATVAGSRQRISNAIDDIHRGGEKITQRKVAEVAGMGVQTVKKYWNEYKTQVKELNGQRKNS